MIHADGHVMHENSLRAWRQLDLPKRQRRVCEILEAHGSRPREGSRGMTDREILEATGQPDPNHVRPSITALIQLGILEEVDHVEDHRTGRRVRKVWFAPAPGTGLFGQRIGG